MLVIDYADAQGRRTERRPVEPMALALERDQAYLLAWCRRRRAGRWFRLDRISAAHVTAEPAPARDVAEVFGPIPEGVGPVGSDASRRRPAASRRIATARRR